MWKIILKPKITIGCQNTEATHLKVTLSRFVLQRRCQVYKSGFEYCWWETLFFFLLRSYVVAASFNNVTLTPSWTCLFKNVVIFLEDLKASLHRLLSLLLYYYYHFYWVLWGLFMRTILHLFIHCNSVHNYINMCLEDTGGFQGNRCQWGNTNLGSIRAQVILLNAFHYIQWISLQPLPSMTPPAMESNY